MDSKSEALEAARANNVNCDEGHLGGYVRADQNPAPSGLGVEHGDPATWTPSLWRWSCERLGVRSVLDLGCGEGHAAKFFRDDGCRVLGVDGSRQAKRDSVIPESHLVHDFNTGSYRPASTFDLVWSCEFVEHVEERYSDHFLVTMSYSHNYVMISYAPPGQDGWHHVNCQSADYWIDKIEQLGFQFDADLTEESRRVAEAGHYHYKGLLFRRVPSTT